MTTKMTRAELESELEYYKVQNNAFANFKRQVVEAALKVKQEHGLCDEVDEVLKELDLEIPVPKSKRVTLVVELPGEYIAGSDLYNDDDELLADLAVEYLAANYNYACELKDWSVEDANS
jgi:hypothetical protein